MKWLWIGYLPHPRDKDSDRKTGGSMIGAEPSRKVLWAKAITSLPFIGWGHGCCHALVQVLIKVVSPLPANGMVVERLGTTPRLAVWQPLSLGNPGTTQYIHTFSMWPARAAAITNGLLCPFLSWMNDSRDDTDIIKCRWPKCLLKCALFRDWMWPKCHEV